jgi:hypothetical protein
MRRSIARGRVFPQSYSTDRRYGRLSLKACALFPLMWANADDQGRLSGDPDEIKYAVCPNIDHITKEDIPELLKNIEQNELIKRYNTRKSAAIQLLDWWEVQRLQWAWPSEYPPFEGWEDRLRYKKGAKEVVTQNWGSPENPPEYSPERSPENSFSSPLTTPYENKKEIEVEELRGSGRGNSPEDSGEDSSPSPTTDLQIINRFLIKSFRHEWGRVPAEAPYTVIEREPDARELAQLRDLGKELSARGGVPLDYIKQAFGEAAGARKFHISYARAVLLDWLGMARSCST